MTENDENADATTSDVVKSEEKGDVEESKNQEETPEATEKHVSHIRNDVHSPSVRWGVLLFLLATFILFVFADFGSGVTAESIVMENGEVYETTTILNVSVVSSVGKLWEAESYPLAIFIAITSIGWPYIKLALATVAWVTPYANPRRREFFIEVIDALGKWSFVDIMVLVEIMVAFRSSLALAPGLSLDIVIVAQWGFYGFVSCFLLLWIFYCRVVRIYFYFPHFLVHDFERWDATKRLLRRCCLSHRRTSSCIIIAKFITTR